MNVDHVIDYYKEMMTCNERFTFNIW